MTTILPRRSAAILLAVLIISGCGPEGGDKAKTAPAKKPAAEKPAAVAEETTRADDTAAEKTLARSEEPRRLEPLVLPLDGEKGTLLDRLDSDTKKPKESSDKDSPPKTLLELPEDKQAPIKIPPRDDNPLKQAPVEIPVKQSAEEEIQPKQSALTSNSEAALSTKKDPPEQTQPPGNPQPLQDGMRTNPLRKKQQSSWLKNPMREGTAKAPADVKPSGPFGSQPIATTALPVASSQEQPAAGKPAQAPPAQPSSAQSAAGQSTSEPPATVHSESPTQQQPAVKSKKDAAKDFDPIKENGPIFVGWEKPALAILITGREDGYIEPCGCAGLNKMKGGLSRRHTLINELLEKKWPLVRVDVGGLSKGYGVQAEMKFRFTVDAMKTMGYHAIGFSRNDLRLPVDELIAVADGSEKNPSPFVSANVGLLGFDAEITTPWRVVEAGGIKVGVTSIFGKEYQKKLAGGEIEFVDPEKALAPIVPEMKKHCKPMILLAHATLEESRALSKRFKDFAVVVTSGGPPTPPEKPTIIEESQALLIEVGEKGMDAIVLGIYRDPKRPYRYQRVPLDSRFSASKDMKLMMKIYQEQLKKMGLTGLALKPVKHPMSDVNGDFVGTKACRNCHEPSYDVWKKSGHAKAWSTLLETDPPRNHDPECISCHVIGWHPTKYFPYKSGFLSEKTTPKMLDVGCESCHGPGEAHVKAEMGNDEALQLRMQKAVRITLEEAKNNYERGCLSCHDIDNSPDFNFETYWPKVEHKENE